MRCLLVLELRQDGVGWGHLGDWLQERKGSPMNDTKLNPSLASRGIWARIFIKEGRLRPTLRILPYAPTYLLVKLTVNSVLGWFVLNRSSVPDWLRQASTYVMNVACVVLAVYLLRRFLDGRTLSSLGLSPYRGWLADIAAGIGLGALLELLSFLAKWGGGWLTIHGFAWQSLSTGDLLSGLALGCLAFVMVGFNEELIFRGYIMQNLAEDWGMAVAVLATSVFFGVAHWIFDPDVSLVSIFSIALGGIFVAYGFLITRSLWLPIAIHFSADFFGAVVFGLPLAGSLEDFRLVHVSVSGPEFITGGSFGTTGLINLGTILLGIGLLWAWGRARQRHLGQSQTTGESA